VKVSALCDHCYAETWTNRYGGDFTNRRRFIKSSASAALKWDAEARKTGVRKRVFCMSMGDIFEQLPDGHPDKIEMDHKRMHAFELMDTTDALDWLVLTKRISNVKKMIPRRWLNDWPSHIRLGISVGTQKDADRDIPRLLEIDCPNFLSMEPLLERVDLAKSLQKWQPHWSDNDFLAYAKESLHWVITGGESGPHARPSHPDWFRSLRDQCRDVGVPFHFKQHGEHVPFDQWPEHVQRGFACAVHVDGRRVPALIPPFDHSEGWKPMIRVGKKAAGHLLDGEVWQQFPALTGSLFAVAAAGAGAGEGGGGA